MLLRNELIQGCQNFTHLCKMIEYPYGNAKNLATLNESVFQTIEFESLLVLVSIFSFFY